ncbi:hypothetical protein ACQKP1_03965 [Allorhizobium sp. NPDC080224]|uniref:hypothetical protein n=1 Tax=Allorhizobium sp. NPDC080224 TaxID=3390547 RepID=UPI003D06F24A
MRFIGIPGGTAAAAEAGSHTPIALRLKLDNYDRQSAASRGSDTCGETPSRWCESATRREAFPYVEVSPRRGEVIFLRRLQWFR